MTPDEAVELLRGTVAIASPSGSEGPVAEHLVRALARCCHTAYVDEVGNAVGHWGHGPLRVWLLGHLDTVPGHIDVRIEHGVLHGRGAVDAKGSLCTFVAALACLDADLTELLSVTVIGAVGEEAPCSVGARHAVASLAAPDVVIVGEPSGWDGITLGYKGTVQVELAATQPSRHSAVDAATPAEVLVDAYGSLRQWVECLNDAEGEPPTRFETLQLRLLRFDTSDDGLAHGATMRLGFRLPPSVTADDVIARCESATDGAARATEGGERPVTATCSPVPGAVDAYRGDRSGAVHGALRSAIRAAGGTPRHILKTGTADMNVVAAAWTAAGVDLPDMVAYGPGDSALDHAPDERIEVAEYLKAISVVRGALTALARV